MSKSACALYDIGTSYPRIATNFQSLNLAEIFVLLLWNLSWWLLLPFLRFLKFFIVFCREVLQSLNSITSADHHLENDCQFQRFQCARPRWAQRLLPLSAVFQVGCRVRRHASADWCAVNCRFKSRGCPKNTDRRRLKFSFLHQLVTKLLSLCCARF